MTTFRFFVSRAAAPRSFASRCTAAWARTLLGLVLMPLAGAALALDINQASPSELDAVNGIGPKMMQRITAARQQAPFKDWADVRTRVSGIGDKTQKRFESQGLTVGPATRVAASSTAATAAPAAPRPVTATKPLVKP